MAKVLMTGNTAIGEAAIRAGCQCYFGYPITPQNELDRVHGYPPEPEERVLFYSGGERDCGHQYGVRSQPGRGQSHDLVLQPRHQPEAGRDIISGSLRTPAVIVNMSRGGPGLGSISAAQSDYFQATRGGGHGDYRTIVLAPSSVQELADFTHHAFELADKYLIPVIILGDGMLGQMMEPVEFKHEAPEELPIRSRALRGAKGGPAGLSRPLPPSRQSWRR